MLRTTFCGCVLGCCVALAGIARGAEELRTWHLELATGKQTVEAQAIDLKAGKLQLRDRAGKEREVELQQLPEDERKQALFDVVGRGVALVETKDLFDRELGVGSCFLFARDGYLLTNRHVIRGAASIRVKFRGAEESIAAECHAVDEALDIAVLKIGKVPDGAHVLTLARDKPTIGAAAWTLGYPNRILTSDWGAANGVHPTKELPQNLRVWIKSSADTVWIQTSAVLNSGSSGSPLLNERGQVLGINTFIAGPQQGFALAIAQAAETYRQAKQAKALALPITPGTDEPTLSWLSREVAPLVKQQSEEYQKFQAESPTLTPAELTKRAAEIQLRYRQSYLELARREPQSWPSAQALLFACDCSLGDTDDARAGLTDICSLVAEHHLKTRKAFEFTQKLGGRPDQASLTLCRQVYESSPYVDVQAHAAQGLAMGRMNWLLKQGGPDRDATAAARSEIDQLLAQLQGKYADVALGGIPCKETSGQLRQYLATIHVGLPALPVEGQTTAGKAIKLSDYRGKVVMLDFFADYCPPCRSMYPAEQKLCARMKDRPFTLLGVNGDEAKVLAEIEKAGTVVWPSLVDGPRGPIAAKWRVTAVPTIFLIDGAGVVRRQYVGTPAAGEIEQVAESLVSEAEQR